MSTDAADGPADVEVVFGRIGKPHGLHGEVTVDVRTDEPERRFAPGSTLRAEPLRTALRRFKRPATIISESPNEESHQAVKAILAPSRRKMKKG